MTGLRATVRLHLLTDILKEFSTIFKDCLGWNAIKSDSVEPLS
jgi:hypothetical protein